MNRTRIEYCDWTWNPATGCLHGCEYCYARRLAKRLRGRFGYPKDYPFRPTFHPDRLVEPYRLKKPSKIFVVDMGDLFGEWVPDIWIEKILKVVEDNSRHTSQFLTKNPKRMYGWLFPENAWLGATINNQQMVELAYDLSLSDMSVRVVRNQKRIKFISFEPFLEDITIDLSEIDWVIVGAQTNPYRPPKREWVEHIIEQARESDIPIFLKDNLRWDEVIRQYPTVEGDRD